MIGLSVLTRSLSAAVPMGASRLRWKYHSRSDRHSKAACWGILVDLLSSCPTLRRDVESGATGFGINHTMRDFRNDRKKNLDLVLCRPADARPSTRRPRSLRELADHWALDLDDAARDALDGVPSIFEAPVGAVLCALEAKACMTAHQKAMPRLYDELNSSHQTVHGASQVAIAAGFVMINVAPQFFSPERAGPGDVRVCSEHPNIRRVAGLVVEKMKELPKRTGGTDSGFDALGIALVNCRNDLDSPTTIDSEPPAPSHGSIYEYEQMVLRVAQLYEANFRRADIGRSSSGR